MIEGDALAVGLEEVPGRAHREDGHEREYFRIRTSNRDIQRLDNQTETPSDRGESQTAVTDWHRLFERASECISRGKFHLAIALLQRVLKRFPNQSAAWHQLGFAYGELGRRERAILCYDNVLNIEPRWAEAWNNRGWNKFKCRQYASAIADFNQAVSLTPDNANTWLNLGMAQEKVGNKSEARKALRKAKACGEISAIQWYGIAKCSGQLGDRKEAIDGFRLACDRDPALIRAWIQLVWRIRARSDWPRSSESRLPTLLDPLPHAVPLPNMGTIIERDEFRLEQSSGRLNGHLNAAWVMIQNPVAWILILVFSALLYILLGK